MSTYRELSVKHYRLYKEYLKKQTKEVTKMNTTKRPTIQLIGAPGSGKSTIAKALSKQLDMPLFIEPYQDNEYIPLVAKGEPFYYECESRMLELTTHQEAIANVAHDGAIIDGGRLQAMGFIRHFLADGKLKPEEYVSLCSQMAASLDLHPKADFVFMLEASPGTLKARVKRRGRDFEQGYTKKYLRSLQDSIFIESAFVGRIMIKSEGDVLDVLGRILDILDESR